MSYHLPQAKRLERLGMGRAPAYPPAGPRRPFPVGWWHNRERTISMFHPSIDIRRGRNGDTYTVTYPEPSEPWLATLWRSVQPFEVRIPS